MANHTSIGCSALLASATLVILQCSTCNCFQFSYPTFDTANKDDFSFSPDSGIANGSLQITPNTGDMSHRSGRVLYAREALKLWNRERTALTSFTTEFILNIRPQNGTGEGMAFILTNKPSLPSNSSGQWLGLANSQMDGAPANRLVAVEFDTRKSNKNDPDGNHVGLEINGIKTFAPYTLSIGMDVAVKRVSTSGNSRRGEQEFIAEVNTISKLSHRNLVKLIGWCHERGELLLVYEYFPMGSLDKLLYADARTTASPPPDLTWERRHRIICGVASSLDYLHHGSSKRVLHRDVKASNVMLDDEYNAKLGDLGLARVLQRDGATHHSTRAVAGTRAYMAYETFFTGRASLDTDVYAFGVFVMEVVSGRRPSSSLSYREEEEDTEETTTTTTTCSSSRRRHGQAMYIVDWVWRLYGEGRALHAADAALNGEFETVQVECAVRLALACCHPNPRERPSMKAVVQVLVGGAKAPVPPFQKPAFVWPPEGEQEDMELPHVGLLFTGGHSSFCSMTSNSITGR